MRILLLSIEAYLLLIAHDILLSRRDFGAVCRRVRETQLQSRSASAPPTTDIESALGTACAFYPKRVLCLQRSTVLIQMLRARGVAAKLVIGTQTLPFRAHAWVEIGEDILSDQAASRGTFQILEVL